MYWAPDHEERLADCWRPLSTLAASALVAMISSRSATGGVSNSGEAGDRRDCQRRTTPAPGPEPEACARVDILRVIGRPRPLQLSGHGSGVLGGVGSLEGRRPSSPAKPSGGRVATGRPLAYTYTGAGVRVGRCQERRLLQGSRLRFPIRERCVPRREPDRRSGPTLGLREDRYRLLGAIEGRVFVLIYTMRGSAIRIISARKANSKEVREYEQNTSEG